MLIKATALFSEASTFLRDYARQSETDAWVAFHWQCCKTAN
jgi:hypothetical protein